jgi:ComF family protein
VQRFAPPVPRCVQCALRLPHEATRCGACVTRRDPPVRHTVAAVDYGFPWDGLITGFKFHHRLDLVQGFAGLLHAALQRAQAPRPQLVLPIPLSAERLRERGYNQAWELARRVARWNGLQADPGVLLRIKNTAHQLGLDEAERQRNLKGAFLVEPRRMQQVQGRAVALVDDVMTSGATADEAARTLRNAGAADVQLWVLARTPPPSA